MATITGLTAEAMQAIVAGTVIAADVEGDDLWLTMKDNSRIDAGNVRGPIGPMGPMTPVAESADYTAAANQIVLMTGAHTVTFPNPGTLGATVKVCALTDMVTVKPGTGASLKDYTGGTHLTIGIPSGSSAEFTFLGGYWYMTDLTLRNLGYVTRNTPAMGTIGIGVGIANIDSFPIVVANPLGAVVTVEGFVGFFSTIAPSNISIWCEIDGHPANAANQRVAFYVNIANNHEVVPFFIRSLDDSGNPIKLAQGTHTVAVGVVCQSGNFSTNANDSFGCTAREEL